MTWYYGHFHGIFKRNNGFCDSNSDDEDDNDSELDSEDDAIMAAKLSQQVADDHKLALELQKSLDSADDATSDVNGASSAPAASAKPAGAKVPAAGAASRTDDTANKRAKHSDSTRSQANAPAVHAGAKVPAAGAESRSATLQQNVVFPESHWDASDSDEEVVPPTALEWLRGAIVFTSLSGHELRCTVTGRVVNHTTRRVSKYTVQFDDETSQVVAASYVYWPSRMSQSKSGNVSKSVINVHSSSEDEEGHAIGSLKSPAPKAARRNLLKDTEVDNDGDGDSPDFGDNFHDHITGDAGDDGGDEIASNLSDGDVSEDQNPCLNASGIEALEMQKAALTIELSDISAEEIWKMLINTTLRGGYIARSLFIAGKALEPKICDPWIGAKQLNKGRKAELADQRHLFLSWASSPAVLEWIRLEIFKIVLCKPQTYKDFNVTHKKGPRALVAADGKDLLQATQASDSVMARVAHLACDPNSRVVLNALMGTKPRAALEADMVPSCLWEDLASVYVNNPHWDIRQMDVIQLQQIRDSSSKIDVQQVSPIGLTAECVRLVWLEVKNMYTDLEDSICRSGSNTVGEEHYGIAWKSYINGGLKFFPRPLVAMYVYKLWNECEGLPKYCTKMLSEEAQLRLGTRRNARFALPTTSRGSTPKTPKSSSGSQQFHSPSTDTTASMSSMDAIAAYMTYKMNEEIAAKAMSIAPKPEVKL